jgi:hypothetical protein
MHTGTCLDYSEIVQAPFWPSNPPVGASHAYAGRSPPSADHLRFSVRHDVHSHLLLLGQRLDWHEASLRQWCLVDVSETLFRTLEDACTFCDGAFWLDAIAINLADLIERG